MATAASSSTVAGPFPADQTSPASSATIQVQAAASVSAHTQFLRFPHGILTNILAPQPIPRQRGQRRRKPFKFTSLPDDLVVMIIKEYLNTFDCAAFSLVCKAFAHKIVSLRAILPLPTADEEQHHDQMTYFFKKTLRSWFPPHLKFCISCGMYTPKDPAYWRETLAREFAGRPGNQARNFFERTAAQDSWASMERYYAGWSGRSQYRTCPRCGCHNSPR